MRKVTEVIVYLIAMLVVLAVAAGVVGMVLVGIEGRKLERYPQLAHFLTRAAAHLSGEAAETRGPASARSTTGALEARPVEVPVRERV
ncbi:hypothetical protein FHX74_003958 [Friedmanniella endophytica]|uniref:Uncharacterized protein n=1 Tax=Microlunatus kandeliicorticis TaxID=1759536 RepID=A0A7W3IUZ0_9ACTN|nr:hypothetical protein [Microlunatus kandeliicorticis]MBA8795737.1 hypothetical protein [Microlunatus kandeliicorticis]MBA8796305.1 hypothetical protein [Microlunatus kandeliicorticis]